MRTATISRTYCPSTQPYTGQIRLVEQRAATRAHPSIRHLGHTPGRFQRSRMCMARWVLAMKAMDMPRPGACQQQIIFRTDMLPKAHGTISSRAKRWLALVKHGELDSL